MLFNSFTFLFLYLPLVIAGYAACARWLPCAANGWLALASLYFYAYWNWHFLPLLLVSIGFNYYCADRIRQRARFWLTLGLAGNLALLGYFKYASFLLETMAALRGTGWRGWHQILPIGISFFTFTQIAFLLDTARGKAGRYSLTDYVLFVSYFPHLIAGPVLHHGEMMPQFARQAGLKAGYVAPGIAIFVFGLAKKVLLADPLVPLVTPVFAEGAAATLLEAWVGVLAYSFQLYFDFSGYSDMAVGLSLLFGVRLPWNFSSPYRASNIASFWRRWHMTLSRFLRDYLYLPLGGNRYCHYRNLMLTMLLGGLWHGAAWNFVVWGGIHGLLLCGYQYWHSRKLGELPAFWAGSITFLCVTLAWVVFRAPNMAGALDVYRGLFGLNGISLPHGLDRISGWLPSAVSFQGLRWIELEGSGLPTLLIAALLAFCAPNTSQIFQRPYAGEHTPDLSTRWSWRANRRWSWLCSLLLLSSVLNLHRVSEFLYFQF